MRRSSKFIIFLWFTFWYCLVTFFIVMSVMQDGVKIEKYYEQILAYTAIGAASSVILIFLVSRVRISLRKSPKRAKLQRKLPDK